MNQQALPTWPRYSPATQMVEAMARMHSRMYSLSIAATDSATAYDDYIAARRWERSCGQATQYFERALVAHILRDNAEAQARRKQAMESHPAFIHAQQRADRAERKSKLKVVK